MASTQTSKSNNLLFIGGIILLASLVGLSMWLYLKNNDKKDKKVSNSQVNPCATCADCGCLKQYNCPDYKNCQPSPSPPPSPSPSPNAGPSPSQPSLCDNCSDCDCLKKNNCANYQSACVGPCGQYEDDTGACSQDGVKAYTNAMSSQLSYICKASDRQNQVQECMEMCENGQFGLPMCQSCCQTVCSSINCPPSGGSGPVPPPPRPDGKPGCGECTTICRDDPTGIYGISCDQCNKRCA